MARTDMVAETETVTEIATAIQGPTALKIALSQHPRVIMTAASLTARLITAAKNKP